MLQSNNLIIHLRTLTVSNIMILNFWQTLLRIAISVIGRVEGDLMQDR